MKCGKTGKGKIGEDETFQTLSVLQSVLKVQIVSKMPKKIKAKLTENEDVAQNR